MVDSIVISSLHFATSCSM